MIKTMYDIIINKKLYFEQQNITSKKNFIEGASLLNNRRRSGEACPSCMNSELESMPISFDETYKFDYNASRGVTLALGAIK
ncbi:MAG: hypothetical protein WA667_01565 [Candidatus Nitrosopolaris sp.]